MSRRGAKLTQTDMPEKAGGAEQAQRSRDGKKLRTYLD